MGSCHIAKVWIKKSSGNVKPFVGFVQFISDKTATILKITVIVAYAVHALFLNVSARRRQFLTDNGRTLVGFLSVCCTR